MPGTPSLVIERHAHTAAVLWLRRDLAVAAPHYNLVDLSRLDDQLEAQLDGLRIAGDAGWEVCREELRWREPGELFVAAVLALQSGVDDRVDTVLQIVGENEVLRRALISACDWLPLTSVQRHLDRFWDSGDPQQRLVALAAWGAHRCDPGPALREALADPRPPLRSRALRAIGQLARTDLLEDTAAALRDAHPQCRLAAACTLARLTSDLRAIVPLREWVETQPGAPQPTDRSGDVLQLVVRRLPPPQTLLWIQNLATTPTTERAAVTAAGLLGLTELVPWLLQVMQIAPYARLAGEAFTMITGVDFANADLETDPPAGFVAGPTDDPEDENVELDPDENLPWPKLDAVADWWGRHGQQFTAGTRYMLGRPIDEPWLQQVLCAGLQRQRIAAAWELAVRQPEQALFPVQAPAPRQRQLLVHR